VKDWRAKYKEKLISVEAAANLVKSGDRVVFGTGREPHSIGLAIAARKEELRDVHIYVPTPGQDFGWYDAGWEESFDITLTFPMAACQHALDERRCDVNLGTFIPYQSYPYDSIDVFIVELSPPDEKGFCSFGASVWDKKKRIKEAKLVLADANANLIRTYGNNFIHASEVDYFVEHIPSGMEPGMRGSLAGRKAKEVEPYQQAITENVSALISDGDTLQIGVGRTTESLVQLGMLNGKHDLGYYSEMATAGVIPLIRDGVISGRRKNINPGIAVVASIGGATLEALQWVNNNPTFHIVDIESLEDIRAIAAHDNMVAINNALMLDLTGQIASETIGTRLLAVAGGQLPFVIGAWLSKGGRSITVLPSTAQGGKTSRILPLLLEGTVVTIHRNFADYVVTEYGIAKLRGKTLRQRVEELIAIAHPDFRAELRKEAAKLYWP